MRINPLLSTIFLCNPKCASTSIENLLDQDQATIVFNGVPRPPVGVGLKHVNAEFTKSKILPFVNSIYPDIQFTKFCVVREPLDHLFSWWKYRTKLAINSPMSTKKIQFADFIQRYIDFREGDNSAPAYVKVRGQSEFVLDEDQKVFTDKVFTLDRIDLVERFISDRAGKNLSLDMHNRSPSAVESSKSLESKLTEKLRKFLSDDDEIYKLASISPDKVKSSFEFHR